VATSLINVIGTEKRSAIRAGTISRLARIVPQLHSARPRFVAKSLLPVTLKLVSDRQASKHIDVKRANEKLIIEVHRLVGADAIRSSPAWGAMTPAQQQQVTNLWAPSALGAGLGAGLQRAGGNLRVRRETGVGAGRDGRETLSRRPRGGKAALEQRREGSAGSADSRSGKRGAARKPRLRRPRPAASSGAGVVGIPAAAVAAASNLAVAGFDVSGFASGTTRITSNARDAAPVKTRSSNFMY
jgi:hypothetical protein